MKQKVDDYVNSKNRVFQGTELAEKVLQQPLQSLVSQLGV